MLVLKGRLPHPLSPGNFAKFDTKVKREIAWKSSNGWKVSKDTAKHGGRVWKLLDKSGKRIASLGADGSVLAR